MTTFLPATTEVAALTARLTTSGHSPVVIDGSADRDGTLDAFAAAVHFPDCFGRNFDALLPARPRRRHRADLDRRRREPPTVPATAAA